MDELLPSRVVKIWSPKSENQEPGNENTVPNASTTTELKDWRRQLQYSFDKLRDHFCRQYVLSFIYSREGKTRLNARIYLGGDGEDSEWDTLPSLPFQALFAKLQQLATVAGDVPLGKEKLQKILLARLTETVLMWLSDEQEFWGVFEYKSTPLQPLGLQQVLIFTFFWQLKLPHLISALPVDEWFVETAKSAISKLLMGASGSDTSEIDYEHIILHDDIVSDSDDTASLSSVESFESFASASMGELESPNFTDQES